MLAWSTRRKPPTVSNAGNCTRTRLCAVLIKRSPAMLASAGMLIAVTW